MTKDYKVDFTEAVGELFRLASAREKLETDIAKQKKRVAALYELAQMDDDGGPISGLVEGLTDACRVVFRTAEKPLLPAEVRDRVQSLGLPPQANLLASIHTTLKRMKESQEIEEVSVPLQTGGMGWAYKWNEKRLGLGNLLDTRETTWYAVVMEAIEAQQAAAIAAVKAAEEASGVHSPKGARFPKQGPNR